jgi:SAM-dependent methyltransferase
MPTMLKKVKAPDAVGREAMYFPDRQDEAYRRGAYDYLKTIAMKPRMAIISSYIQALGVRRVLDVGCGFGELVAALDPAVAYCGIDISAAAIASAQNQFAAREHTEFLVANFREWDAENRSFDCVVWAGIGCTWTRKGKGGTASDWLDILRLSERRLEPNGVLIFELVTPHWPSLAKLAEGRYDYLTGCDLDCFQSEESPKRSFRVFRPKKA